MSKNHYTYRITNIKENKHYYGCRTCKYNPKDDIGIKYFSSSTDKKFIKDQKSNPQNYKYKIIKTFKSRKEAIQFEIKLHNKFNVGVSESFYNKVKQTSSGFDGSGIPSKPLFGEKNGMYGRKRSPEELKKISEGTKRGMAKCKNKPWKHQNMSQETKEKIRQANLGKKASEKTKRKMSEKRLGKNNGMYGKKHSEEAKRKMSETKKGTIPYNKGKKELIVICPHCKKEGGRNAMFRYHFDKCKLKITPIDVA